MHIIQSNWGLQCIDNLTMAIVKWNGTLLQVIFDSPFFCNIHAHCIVYTNLTNQRD